jgi:hypothetical protein
MLTICVVFSSLYKMAASSETREMKVLCDAHKEEAVRLFCVDCEAVICLMCFFLFSSQISSVAAATQVRIPLNTFF